MKNHSENPKEQQKNPKKNRIICNVSDTKYEIIKKVATKVMR